MATKYNSNYDLSRPFVVESVQFHLTTAGGVDTYTLPGDEKKKYAIRFGYNSDSNVFVRLNGAPAVPAGSTVTTLSYCEFKPGYDGTQRYANGGDVIQMITPDTDAYVSIAIMEVQ